MRPCPCLSRHVPRSPPLYLMPRLLLLRRSSTALGAYLPVWSHELFFGPVAWALWGLGKVKPHSRLRQSTAITAPSNVVAAIRRAPGAQSGRAWRGGLGPGPQQGLACLPTGPGIRAATRLPPVGPVHQGSQRRGGGGELLLGGRARQEAAAQVGAAPRCHGRRPGRHPEPRTRGAAGPAQLQALLCRRGRGVPGLLLARANLGSGRPDSG